MGQIANKLLALNSAKHAIREAINLKGGGPMAVNAPLSAYPAAVASIPQGGGGGGISDPFAAYLDYYRVIFIDWDGTVLQDTLVPKGQAVTPPTVSHPNMTFVRWTVANTEFEAVNRDMCVGACYGTQTVDGWDSSFVINLDRSISGGLTVSFKMQILSGYPGKVDWGDGNIDTVSVSGSRTVTHTYAQDGAYTIVGWRSGGRGWLNSVESIDFYGTIMSILSFPTMNTGIIEKFHGIGVGNGIGFSALGNANATGTSRLELPGFVDASGNTTAKQINCLPKSGVFNLATNWDCVYTLPNASAINYAFIPVIDFLWPPASSTDGVKIGCDRLILRGNVSQTPYLMRYQSNVIDFRFVTTFTGSFHTQYYGYFIARVNPDGVTPSGSFTIARHMKNWAEFLHSLLAVSSTKTITIALKGYEKDVTYAALVTELQGKGYTVTTQA